MSRLTDLALRFVPRDEPVRALVAAVGDGTHLVALADDFLAEARYANVEPPLRASDVLRRLRGTDDQDRGASGRVLAWARTHDASPDGVLSFGDPLAFADDHVQGELFGATPMRRPPSAFAEAPFDLVVADVRRRELEPSERDEARARYAAARQRFTSEVPYVERLLDLVRPDGIIALRIRAAVLRREFGRALVDEVGRRTRLLTVERDGDWLYVVLALWTPGDGATLLRAFGSEAAAQTLRAIEAGAVAQLGELLDGSVGPSAAPGFDDVWEPPRWLESRVPTMPYARGTDIRCGTVQPSSRILWPYDEHGHRRTPPDEGVVAWLARFRPLLEGRELFGRSLGDRDVRWFEYLEHHVPRYNRVPAVVVARSARVPRVATLREPAVVGPGALLLHPRDPRDLAFVRGVVGSALAAFWMKQSFHVWEHDDHTVFELTAVGLEKLPMPRRSEAVVEAASALERVARSVRPLASAIAGEPERLGARLDATRATNARLALELDALQRRLDEAVLDAYGVASASARERVLTPEFVPTYAVDDDERGALLDWLVARVEDGFASGELDDRRPLSALDLGDWLRREPLTRAVLARAAVDPVDVVLHGAVPLEPSIRLTASGLERLSEWSAGRPQPFRKDDYAARSISCPAVALTPLRAAIWRWRGRYNVPREPFALLVELSEARGHAMFAWAGADESARAGWARTDVGAAESSEQVDLERLLRLRVQIAQAPATATELAHALFGRGWSARDVDLGLRALERAGHIVQRGERWHLC